MVFTDKFVKALQPRQHSYKLHEAGSDKGFCIRVTPAGHKTFLQQYSIDGTRRYLRLGSYPDTSLADARKRAREARGLVDQGIDPQEVAASNKRKARLHGTVDLLFSGYLSYMLKIGRRSVSDVKRSLEKDALPYLTGMAARDVTAEHIRNILYTVIARGAERQANRLRSYLHSAFNWGIHHDNDPRSMGSPVLFGITFNPVSQVPKNPDAEHVGERNLSFDEITRIWHDPAIPLHHRLALRLILASGGQRPGEITGARLNEFDLENSLWMMPLERVKNKRHHLLPLPDLALAVIDDIQCLHGRSGEWLFPAHGDPTSLGAQNKSTLSSAVKPYCIQQGMEPWTPVDLRRTAKTRMGEIGIEKSVRDRIQNHALTDVSTRHYDRYDYLPEKREALKAWCEYLSSLLRL